jgi:hypothetical protein
LIVRERETYPSSAVHILAAGLDYIAELFVFLLLAHLLLLSHGRGNHYTHYSSFGTISMVKKRSYKRWVPVATLFFLLLGSSAFTQEKGKDAPKEDVGLEMKNQPRNRSLVRSGYTRPGSPSDKIGKNGAIVQAALDPDQIGRMIGSTVYFAVFKGTGVDDDMFGTDIGGLADAFVAGRSFENSVSPHLDRKAKYLYLYQIVNDRGLNPPKEGVLPAVDTHIHTADISNFALRLLVDPRYITSWGHFTNIGFEANVADRKVGKGGMIGAADETQILPMAISSNPAIVKELANKRFQEGAPAYGLGNLLNHFGLDKSNLNLQNSSAHASLLKKKGEGKEINWVANGIEAAVQGGREPDFVQIVLSMFKEDAEPTLEGRHIGDTIFRVDFKKANAVKVGQHSVVFGFTSDLPPTDEPIRVEGPMPKLGPDAERKAKDASGAGQAAATALGTAPTPIGGGGGAVGAMTSALIGGGTLGGGGGFGGGFLPFPGAFFGAARAPSAASGIGSGQGTTQAQQAQAQNQNQQVPNTNTINFAATLTNQQAQQQAQLQAQLQAQAQAQLQIQNNRHHHHHHNNHMVPEPSAIILGLLGLPALFFFRRRGQTHTAAVS